MRRTAMIPLLLMCSVTVAEVYPTVAAKLTYPARASIEIGIATGDLGTIFSIGEGFVIRAEPGISGGKLHAGLRHQFTFLFLPLATWDYTLSVLHTWGDPLGSYPPGQTYLGLELQSKVNLFLMSAGGYWKVAGDQDHSGVVFSGAIGVGF